VGALANCEIAGVEVEGQDATVEVIILTGTVFHTLKVPSAERVLKLNRSARVLNYPYNIQRIRVGVMAGAEVWDKCGGRAPEGYAGAVPAVHKDAAVRAVIEYIDREMGASNDEQGF